MTTTDLAVVEDLPITATNLGLVQVANRTRDLEISEWAELGRALASQANGWLWSVGDWFTLGEETYGSTYAEAQAITGLAYQTLANTAVICKAVGLSRRRESLSFAHHAEVAALPVWQQERFLALAENDGLTRDQLRAAIRGERELPAAVAPLARVQFEAPPDQAKRWQAAAAAAGVAFGEWASDALDRAAA